MALCELREHLGISKSSYFYCRLVCRNDKYSEVRRLIARLFTESDRRYGYRRVHLLLAREGVTISEKVVRDSRATPAESAVASPTPLRVRPRG